MSIPPPPGPQQPGGPHPQGPYQQPYGPGSPYQPWGQGYSPYNRPAPVNGLAVAALVLGILCFLPAVGLVLGLIALAQIRRRGERGRGLAIGGMVVSSLGLALFVLVFATGGAHQFWEGFKDGARGARGNGVPFSVQKGECFNAPGGALEGEAYDIDKVACSGKHQAEVFANFTLPDGSYPGDAALGEKADTKCYTLHAAYAMDSWAIPDDVDVYYFTPTRESWAYGDREVTCMFGNTDEKASLTGTLRRDATTLSADQLAYLRADAILYDALETAPDAEYVEDDLPGHKQWAARVAAALADQTRELHGHAWRDGAGGPVTGQAAALDRARTEWGKAAEATDADTFYIHYDRGSSLLEGRAAVTARKALGLATTPPSRAEDGDGGGDSGSDGGKKV
ncbi:DUF4190 domain-containing protein [Streptomyces chiangmaiensis]|uniref:DUF4190 domain-containing protein n=1 Tax=Streptomyces chiangmaiensis TaxID=766497 RepID=A0ABU7FAT5_9ACTN|nr:DUF4190 domain-containing protein [Streptomyces chiangmaiensis]MED7821086.1 DUF4190 domain-containing protein [Streptomyces chiangmaiensis]